MASKELPHFFDITNSLSGPSRSWSPNTLRTRLILNFKGIRYTESYISYPDIAPLLKSLSVPALSRGIPYTLPAILHGPSVSTPSGAMNDSWPIALHLEKAFPPPEYPSIFPSPASYELALAVQKIISVAINKGATLVIPKIADILDPRGSEYFYRTREKTFKKPLPELLPKGKDLDTVWKGVRFELEVLTSMLKGREGKKGPFFEGETAGYADFLVVGFLAWYERADRKDWEMLMKIGNGEFKRLWDATLPWLEGKGEEKEWSIAKI